MNTLQTLDIGCGNAKTPGAIGIDSNPSTQADVIHDLNVYPWPLESNRFDVIIGNHIIEHVADMLKFMEEVHRVSKIGARSRFVTPHFSNRFSYTDPTHIRHLSIRSLDYFAPKRNLIINGVTRIFETQFTVPDFYTHPLFRIIYARVSMARPFRLTGIQRFANRFPDFYELYLTFIFPARDLYFEIETLK
jgi:SAM-dependent methyltransferase